ncbi:hypothetical protein Ddye_025051 [Dipteronia dyeriana]|uniref:BZIP domain-containing protein n=1 Tax=Dipteronia dyeriana TaxID=168575 RepID=A0AAD9TWK7_9ROSI|nr:hypothetical protein Ddye_025051 [Dipteronia dyeriana]
MMFPSAIPLEPTIFPSTVPLAPSSAVSLAPTTFQIWNRSDSVNFVGNSSTDQAMVSSSSRNSNSSSSGSSSSSSITNPNSFPQPLLLSSNNDIGKRKGLMMTQSPMSDKNPIPIVDAPGYDNTTGETNAQTCFQFNASRTNPNIDEKKNRRTISNRLSAERIRKKRAQYVKELERKLKNLEVRIAVQRPQISQDKEHVQFLHMEHLKRLNQILNDKKNGLMRIDASIAQNKEAVKIWRQQELIQQQKMMQTQQRHQQKIMQMQQQQQQQQQQQLMQMQQQQQKRPVWETGLERIMNPNPSLNQSVWLDQQQMGYPNSIQGIYGVNTKEMNRLNEHVIKQPAANRFNQLVTMNQHATNRLNQHVAMNQPAANRLNEHVPVNQPIPVENRGTNGHEWLINNNMFNSKHIIINQPAGVPEYSGARPVTNDLQMLIHKNMLNQHVIVNQPAASVEYSSARALQNAHQMLINNNRLNQPTAVDHGSATIETNDGHELLMNNNMLNQQVPINQQVLANQQVTMNQPAGHELLVNSSWLNQQQVPMNQPAVMEYGVAPAETNGGHELLIMNNIRLNQLQVPMNQPAAAYQYGGSTNDHQLLMNYQLQPAGQMLVSTDWDQLGMDLQMPNQLPGQMMALPDNWDQIGMVQIPNPNSNMMNDTNYQLDELEQFKNLNLNPPNLLN